MIASGEKLPEDVELIDIERLFGQGRRIGRAERTEDGREEQREEVDGRVTSDRSASDPTGYEGTAWSRWRSQTPRRRVIGLSSHPLLCVFSLLSPLC